MKHKGALWGGLLSSWCAAQGVMTSPASFSVGETGGATYAISIVVPPGVGGMEPKLALSYNSQMGNGPLGMGWSLAGLSAIARCPRTKAQDGTQGAVSFDNNDRYCLDGRRLMLVNVNHTYGGNGTEYRTERDDFAKIVSYGTAGNGPAYFKVWTKAGLVMEYGVTADSLIEAVKASSRATWPAETARVWAVGKVSDTVGNYLTVTYIKDAVKGQFYPTRIDYTGNGAKAPNNSVQFQYESRQDSAPVHVGGAVVQGTNRLINIQTYVGQTKIKQYNLTYQQSASTNRSRVASVRECDGDGQCRQPLAFQWAEQSPRATDAGTWATGKYGSWYDNADRVRSMDVNGDGLMDFVIGPNSDGNWFVMRNTGSSFVDEGAWISGAYGNWNGKASRIWPVDVNGDGLMDIVLGPEKNGNWYVLRNTGTSFVDTGTWATGAFGDWYDKVSRIRPMDINGDGLIDFVIGPDSSGNWYALRNTGTSFVNDGAWLSGAYGNWYGAADRIWVMDVNGDGLQDIVLGPGQDTGNWYVLRSTGTSFVNEGAWLSGAYGNWYGSADRIRMMDVNGDGLQDIVLGPGQDTGNWYVLRSTGTSFVNDGAWLSGAYGDWYKDADRIRAMDVNGDGMMDVVLGPRSDGSWFVLRSTGTSFVVDSAWTAPATGEWYTKTNRISSVETNGDGVSDIVLGPRKDGTWLVMQSPEPPDRLTSISGLPQQNIRVIYGSLAANQAIYVKGTGSTYPRVDLQIPLYVVTSVSTANGIGGTVTTNYKYGGLRAEVGTGRGPLGFAWIESTQLETGVVTRSEYRQDWPYTGLASKNTVSLPGAGNGGLLKESSNTFACFDPASGAGASCVIGAGKRYFPYALQSTEKSWDLNGTALPVITTSSSFDVWGNAIQVTVSNSDGSSKTNTNTYSNDEANWRLGRLLRSTVTSVTP